MMQKLHLDITWGDLINVTECQELFVINQLFATIVMCSQKY